MQSGRCVASFCQKPEHALSIQGHYRAYRVRVAAATTRLHLAVSSYTRRSSAADRKGACAEGMVMGPPRLVFWETPALRPRQPPTGVYGVVVHLAYAQFGLRLLKPCLGILL